MGRKGEKKEGESQPVTVRKRPSIDVKGTENDWGRGGAISQPFSLVHPKSDADVNENVKRRLAGLLLMRRKIRAVATSIVANHKQRRASVNTYFAIGSRDS